MHVVGRELDKPAAEVSKNTLSGMLETAIRSSSASGESAEILARLDVRLLQASPGDQVPCPAPRRCRQRSPPRPESRPRAACHTRTCDRVGRFSRWSTMC